MEAEAKWRHLAADGMVSNGAHLGKSSRVLRSLSRLTRASTRFRWSICGRDSASEKSPVSDCVQDQTDVILSEAISWVRGIGASEMGRAKSVGMSLGEGEARREAR